MPEEKNKHDYNQLRKWYKAISGREKKTRMSSLSADESGTRSPEELNEESKEQLIEQQEYALSPDVLRSEVNFLIFPFFALWDKDVYRRTETEYRAEAQRGDRKIKISWTVSANPKYGYPGPFDRQLHKAIEEIISELEPPIENPIPLGSFRSLCGRMGVQYGGAYVKKIKEAFRRVRATTVDSKAAFYDKKKKRWVEDVFGLYDRMVFKGEELDDGETAETNYLYLGSWYLESINARYVRPLDWGYYKTLKTPIAERLYEVLGVKFYGLFRNGWSHISYKYSKLCDLLPITRQKYLSDAKRILNPAHEQLQETGFLEKYVWRQSKQDKDNWVIEYYPGERAREEFRRFKEGGTRRLESPEKNPGTSRIVVLLTDLGISDKVVRRWVKNYEPEHILEKVDFLAFLEETEHGKIKNPCGWLRMAIEENYGPPDGYKPRAVREAEAAEAERRQREIERQLEEQDKQIEERRGKERQRRADRLTELQEQYGTTQQESDLWQEALAELKLQMPRATFETWFPQTQLLSIEDGVAVISVSNRFGRDWLEKRPPGRIRETLAGLATRPVEKLEFIALQDEPDPHP